LEFEEFVSDAKHLFFQKFNGVIRFGQLRAQLIATCFAELAEPVESEIFSKGYQKGVS